MYKKIFSDEIYFMRTLLLLFIFSAYSFCQNDSSLIIDAESIRCFVQPDSLPQIIGGLDSLQNRLQYPIPALEEGIEGTVYISITIDTLGIPSSPNILKGLGFGCDEEAKRLLMTSKYLPAMIRDKKIKTQFMIPVKFKLPEE